MKPFFDEFYQADLLIPYYKQTFTMDDVDVRKVFPMTLLEEELNDLVAFISTGLWDQDAVLEGSLGNNLTHPSKVPSGLKPSITRDDGNQLELPPNALTSR